MADTYTTRNRVIKPEPGQYTNTWGTTLNNKAFDLIDAAMDGVEAYALSGTKTLTSTNAATDEARMRVQNITSGTGGMVTVPSVQKMYLVRNNASGSVFFSAGGTMATIPAGSTMMVFCDGTDCYTQTPITYAAAADVNYYGTTTASLTNGTGAKSFSMEAGKLFFEDQYIVMSAGSGNIMWGQVTSYNDATGAMVFDSQYAEGAGGPFTSWEIGVTGIQGATGVSYPSLAGNARKVLAANAAADGVEWVAHGWEELASVSPSAVSQQAFTGLGGVGYTEFALRYAVTRSTTAILGLTVSDDGTTYSSTYQNLSASASGDVSGAVNLAQCDQDNGRSSAGWHEGTLGGGRAVSGAGLTGGWQLPDPIDALRVQVPSGTFTGTITLYGRR